MQALSSPEMIAMLLSIILFQAASVLLMMLNIHLFRRQRRKYLQFVQDLGDATALGTPGKALIPLYATVTVVTSIATLYLFAFQPHLL